VHLTTPHRPAPVPATPATIADILRDLPERPDPFVILGGSDEQRYMQTLWTPEGFILEFQEGGIDRHYRCARRDFTADEVSLALGQYLAWNGQWRPAFEAEKVEVRTGFYRFGHALGYFVGRVRRLFSSTT